MSREPKPGINLAQWNAAPWTRMIRLSELQFRIAFYELANKVAVDAGTTMDEVAKFWLTRTTQHPQFIAERENPTEYKA